MSEDKAEEKDQSASGSAGAQEGQGRQSGMSAEENDGGANGEPQNTSNGRESSSNRPDKTQETNTNSFADIATCHSTLKWIRQSTKS